MQTRFSAKAKIFDIMISALAAMFSVGVMLYGVAHFGLKDAWPELVLNVFYIACVIMIWMYFFNYRITTQQFNKFQFAINARTGNSDSCRAGTIRKMNQPVLRLVLGDEHSAKRH